MNIGIVGSGPSAVYAIKHLLAADEPLRITVYEAGEHAGVGTPYDPLTTPVALLANIASVELPPVTETLLAFLKRTGEAELAAIGVDRDAMTERTFHPRVAIGAYYAAQLDALGKVATDRGHTLAIRISCPVVDIWPDGDWVRIRCRPKGVSPTDEVHDKVIIATGHTVPRASAFPFPDLMRVGDRGRSFGILGSSLSAIDIAVSIAAERGEFTYDGYARDEGEEPFTITMMSRGGRLPEADFYCPLPTAPLTGFTQQEVESLAAYAPEGRVLDTVFARFARLLAEEDPAYAQRIDLPHLTPDTFEQAYFAERDAWQPLEWARHNLAEAMGNARARVTVPWRYTILRCHEAFAACLSHLTETERSRFDRGLKKVFVDNYAAVPPVSIQRLLAMHDAGVFDVLRLGDDYSTDVAEDGAVTITTDRRNVLFDAVYDARGQAAADTGDIPFPTLRFLLTSNLRYDADTADDKAVCIDRLYRLSGRLNPLANIWCLGLPFLLSREPFIQGLTSAAKLGQTAAAAILASKPEPDVSIQELLARVRDTDTVIINGGLVVLSPKAT